MYRRTDAYYSCREQMRNGRSSTSRNALVLQSRITEMGSRIQEDKREMEVSNEKVHSKSRGQSPVFKPVLTPRFFRLQHFRRSWQEIGGQQSG